VTIWFREFRRWAAESEVAILCALVITWAMVLGFWSWHSEVSIRSAGYGLQLLGMILAMLGLLRIRAHFGHAPLRRLVIAWLTRFPKWKRGVVVSAPAAAVMFFSTRSRGEIWIPDNSELPCDKRIAGVVANQDRLRLQLSELWNSMEQLKTNQEDTKSRTAKDIKSMSDEIRSNLESLHTSDWAVSLVGLVWLAFGITLSTLAPELFRWLR
jgi:hypothetical protein